MRIKIIWLLAICILTSCDSSAVKIEIEDIGKLKALMVETELLAKKIEVLPFHGNGTYVKFYDLDKGINISYSTLNYDPQNEGKYRNNPQTGVEKYESIAGLTNEEWAKLKENLSQLASYGITSFNPPAGSLTQFFYCDYPQYAESDSLVDMTFLAVLTDEKVNSLNFKIGYYILDEKDGLYLFRARKPEDPKPKGIEFR